MERPCISFIQKNLGQCIKKETKNLVVSEKGANFALANGNDCLESILFGCTRGGIAQSVRASDS